MDIHMVYKALQWCHTNKCKKLEAIFQNEGQTLEIDMRWKSYLVTMEIDVKTDLTNMMVIRNGSVVNEFGLPLPLCFSVLENLKR
jgi:hypothetical protein